MRIFGGIFLTLAEFCVAPQAFAQHLQPEYVREIREKAKTGDAKSQYYLAVNYANENKRKDAWKWLNTSAENGYAEAQSKLGDYYRDGHLIQYGQLNIAINLEKALDWYKRAADQNHLGAIDNMCTLRSHSAVKNLSEALTYCRSASQKGRHSGYFFFGKAYQTGTEDIPQNLETARLIYQELVDKDYTPAIESMTTLEIENSIKTQDYTRSFLALQKAIYLKPETYLVPLARHYENGWGTSKDFSEAHRLYFFSAEMGNPDAKAWIAAHPQASVDNITANLIDRDSLPEGSFKIGANNGSVNFYPPRALDAETEGEVMLICHINYGGQVDNCVVDEETPPNIGFGMATLKVISASGIESDAEILKPYAGKIFPLRYRWILN